MTASRLFRTAVGLLAFSVVFLGVTLVAYAQDTVSDDDVNAVARQLYCPVCENIPLDVCGTTACAQWREEIRIQLVEGETPQQVVTSFVQRFGERVVGTPQDPTLRMISLLTPWLLGGLAIIVAAQTILRWQRRRAAPASAQDSSLPENAYLAQIEADLRERR